ncbi:hypothetical protein [Persicirhabdus sediminis]|uniref:Lactonase, 7-bladed beta-propeller n=1 Tax=Persicirhabdus sediminis TaxID=454144 RepID=A0A8J7MEA6_9BACT|nr:hypothetical protein [Persicirhabdus sediminis]MBK1791122.1 hypothetical protein [Persicirhabdus sediminis]
MKLNWSLILPSAMALTLSQCADTTTSAAELATTPAANVQLSNDPLNVVLGAGDVTVMDGIKVVSILKTSKPNVEQTKFQQGQKQIVVKSRGSHGPAAIQLFDTKSGRELGNVMAYDVKDGQPSWALGMGE